MRRLVLAIALIASLAFGAGAASAQATTPAYCNQIAGVIEFYAAFDIAVSDARADWLGDIIVACGGDDYVAGLSADAHAWLHAEGVAH